MLDEYFKELDRFQPLERGKERETIAKAKTGDRRAYDSIINCNLKFVVSIAKSYQGQGLLLDDLISEGNLGLLKALDRFDLDRNVKFISYAVWWIRQSILNAIHENAKSIRIPLNKIANVAKIDKAREELIEQLGREPSTNELEIFLENPEILIDKQYSYTMIDLNKPQTENDKTLDEIVPAESTLSPENTTEDFLLEFETSLKGFPDRDKQILKMYYGIGYPRAYTLKDIGDELGLTRERIRQIKKRALGRLQLKHRSAKLRSYL
ncbi:MAG TPA: RNA polymerase sigma factor RpoD/SigA [Bacteroidales bacterium]|nr:RNA polymerase sigma factor RpoD/SigA [Bacteroidales bacterium]